MFNLTHMLAEPLLLVEFLCRWLYLFLFVVLYIYIYICFLFVAFVFFVALCSLLFVCQIFGQGFLARWSLSINTMYMFNGDKKEN